MGFVVFEIALLSMHRLTLIDVNDLLIFLIITLQDSKLSLIPRRDGKTRTSFRSSAAQAVYSWIFRSDSPVAGEKTTRGHGRSRKTSPSVYRACFFPVKETLPVVYPPLGNPVPHGPADWRSFLAGPQLLSPFRPLSARRNIISLSGK